MLFLSVNPNTLVEEPMTMAVDVSSSISRYTDGGPVGVGCVVQTGDVSCDSAYDSVDRLLQKFEMALREKSIAPVRRELQLRLLKLSSLELKDNESLSTLESNFSDDNDQLSYEEEDVLEFTEIFDMFEQQAPEGIKANFTKIIESKKIPIRRSRDTQNKKTFFVYAENKIMMKICNNLSPHDVFQMYDILRESKAVERDNFIKNILSQPVDPNALHEIPGLKDVAFYYLILALMRNHMLNRLYTHKLVFLFDQLKQMKVTKKETTQHIERALASLDRYPIASRPPGLCIIFIMVRDRDGAQKDLQRVRELFEKFYAFDVFVKKDPTSEDIKNIVSKLKAARNKFYDSLVVWFMGHGDKTNLKVSNGHIHRRLDLIEPFTQIEWFHKKPKLFFIQACAVKNKKKRLSSTTSPDMRGLPAATDSLGWKAKAGDQWTQKYDEHTDLCTVNTFADTLISYATMWYQSAARNEEGSLYVDTLVDQLRLYGNKESIENVLRRVHYNVNTVSLLSDDGQWKQAPYFESSLQKEFIFPKTDTNEKVNTN
ncbi:hypothetical protein Pmani_039831 [Petrolisthes manimaculis]|uniref:Caspase-8 n=1 Tax=Petrolisthes manimaculis TaxID=1843537 RepID=A0AAE1TKY5_9EUCA|nr:hypothetical protein Pmani_039831 [Petrolisthes manimaculis]